MPPHEDQQQQAFELLNEGARLMHAQRFGEALAVLERAYQILPDDPDVLINLGGALVMTARWSKAVAVLERAVAKHPLHDGLWLNLAAAYLGRLEFSSYSRQEQAISAYQQAIEIDPVAPNAHYNIALIYAERKDWAQAATWFEAALRTHPSDRDAARLLEKARTYQAEEDD
ncbi:MAG: tetratricopeptide repeat protein [Chloroflexi bacterium]|nr:tetratricopeptide repeat protein [Chloroflexota bacterium]